MEAGSRKRNNIMDLSLLTDHCQLKYRRRNEGLGANEKNDNREGRVGRKDKSLESVNPCKYLKVFMKSQKGKNISHIASTNRQTKLPRNVADKSGCFIDGSNVQICDEVIVINSDSDEDSNILSTSFTLTPTLKLESEPLVISSESETLVISSESKPLVISSGDEMTVTNSGGKDNNSRPRHKKKSSFFWIEYTPGMKRTVECGGWLTDQHIALAQQIISQQFPHIGGLQSPLRSQNLSFKAIEGTSLQIHSLGAHWVTSHAKEGKLYIYDSKFNPDECSLSWSLIQQLAKIYPNFISEKKITDLKHLEIPHVQQQQGHSDCGVFAIVFAVHAALGQDVGKVHFNQITMRKHLSRCLENRHFTPFE